MTKKRPINMRALSGPIYDAPRQSGATSAAFEPVYTDKAGSEAIEDIKRISGVNDEGEGK